MTLAELAAVAYTPGKDSFFRYRSGRWLPHARGAWKGQAVLRWFNNYHVPWIFDRRPGGSGAPYGFSLEDLQADDWELVPESELEC